MKIDELIDTWPIEGNYDGQMECAYWDNTKIPQFCLSDAFSTYVPGRENYSVRRLRQQIEAHIRDMHPELLE